jgi:hypothetical protein
MMTGPRPRGMQLRATGHCGDRAECGSRPSAVAAFAQIAAAGHPATPTTVRNAASWPLGSCGKRADRGRRTPTNPASAQIAATATGHPGDRAECDPGRRPLRRARGFWLSDTGRSGVLMSD